MAQDCNPKRISLDMVRKAASIAPSSSSSANKPCSRTSSEIEGARSHLPSGRSAMLHVKDICSTKILGRVSSDCRSVPSKQVHIMQKISHVKSQYFEKLSGCSILDDLSRCPRCLSPCTDEEESSQVPGHFIRKSTLLLPVPTFWLSSSSPGFYSNNEVFHFQIESPRGECPQLLRRPDCVGKIPGKCSSYLCILPLLPPWPW